MIFTIASQAFAECVVIIGFCFQFGFLRPRGVTLAARSRKFPTQAAVRLDVKAR